MGYAQWTGAVDGDLNNNSNWTTPPVGAGVNITNNGIHPSSGTLSDGVINVSGTVNGGTYTSGDHTQLNGGSNIAGGTWNGGHIDTQGGARAYVTGAAVFNCEFRFYSSSTVSGAPTFNANIWIHGPANAIVDLGDATFGGSASIDVQSGAKLSGGTVTIPFTNNGEITGGTFSAVVTNNGTISGGTFLAQTRGETSGSITGGHFKGEWMGVDGNLANTANWVGGVVPADPIISAGGVNPSSGEISCTTLIVDVGATVAGGTINVSGGMSVYTGGTVSAGTFNLGGSSLYNAGTISGGIFDNLSLTNDTNGKISAGTFTNVSGVTNNTTNWPGISGGSITCSGAFNNSGYISGGYITMSGSYGGSNDFNNYSTIDNGYFYGMGPIINNTGSIYSGTFDIQVNSTSYGSISGGTFNNSVNIYDSATISGGIFWSYTSTSSNSNNAVSGGTFNYWTTLHTWSGWPYGYVTGGTFNATVYSENFHIAGGTFNGVTYLGYNYTSTYVHAGTFNGELHISDSGGSTSFDSITGSVVISLPGTFQGNGSWTLPVTFGGMGSVKINNVKTGINGSGILGAI